MNKLAIVALAWITACPGVVSAERSRGLQSARAEARGSLHALAVMPIKEVTVFKDGHAFVLHEGAVPTNEAGSVVMDYLPAPVLGTFWPFSSDPNVRLNAVVSGRRSITIERTALNLRELLEANLGAQVRITETSRLQYPATIVAIPTRSSAELRETSPPNSEARLPKKGDTILLKTAEGIKVVPIGCIADVTFLDPPRPRVANEEFRDLLTLHLDWGGRPPAPTADIGMMYLQKGIRWIPHYKIVPDGEGHAVVSLQATLINELADLHDVTANLVIGVPSFAFRDMLDPIGVQQTLAQLSPHFQSGSQTRYGLSNAIMSQSVRMLDAMPPASAAPADLGPELGDAREHEDLFVFTVKHLTLKRGERMVLPIVECVLEYRDVFTLNIPFAPPPEVRWNFNNQQQTELARLLRKPKVMHKLRLTNGGKFPLTTAPALIVRDGQVLGQGMMTYTAVNATTDLEITLAVDIQVTKTDAETRRTPDAAKWNGNSYTRVDLGGTIALTNHRSRAVDLEVTRYVLGRVGSADHDGVARQINVFEDEGWAARGIYPSWWNWYGWPNWWYHFNGQGSITWKFTLNAGDTIDLAYDWHYFWR